MIYRLVTRGFVQAIICSRVSVSLRDIDSTVEEKIIERAKGKMMLEHLVVAKMGQRVRLWPQLPLCTSHSGGCREILC